MAEAGETTAAQARVRPWPWSVRLVTMILVVGGASALVSLCAVAVSGSAVASVAVGGGFAVGMLWLYRGMVRLTEGRAADEALRAGSRPGVASGLALGAGACTAVIALLALTGCYAITGWGSAGGLITTAGMMAAVAVGEELVMRAVLLRLVEEVTGTWGALAVSGLMFGGLHLLNPGATVWSALGIAVEAGVCLGAAYVLTRKVWLGIGIHFAWNLTLGGVFGAVVSGSDAGPGGLFTAALTGPTFLTGGTAGPEAGGFTLLVWIVPSVLMLQAAYRLGRIRPRRCAA